MHNEQASSALSPEQKEHLSNILQIKSRMLYFDPLLALSLCSSPSSNVALKYPPMDPCHVVKRASVGEYLISTRLKDPQQNNRERVEFYGLSKER